MVYFLPKGHNAEGLGQCTGSKSPTEEATLLGKELKLLKLNLLLACCSLAFSSIFFYYSYGYWSNLKIATWDQNCQYAKTRVFQSWNPQETKYRSIWDNRLSIIFIWISNNIGLTNDNLNTLGFQQHLCTFKWNIILAFCFRDRVLVKQRQFV